ACDSPSPESSVFHPIISYDVKIISKNSSISSFVTSFVQDVCDSDTLTDVFDFSGTTATQLKEHISYDFKKVINAQNFDDADLIADFATRTIDQNFKVVSQDVAVRVYANIAANYAYSAGKLTSKTAESLAKQYADNITETAKQYVNKDDPKTKFTGVGEGVINFILSLQKLTLNEVWQVAFLYQSQFLLAAVEVGGSNDIYDQCIQEANN
ncbi:uncharacterized protein NPIL_79361, partial [Nephila pilipes]